MTEGKSVFVVFSGSYSDKQSLAAFTTEDKANEWIGEFQDTYEIEELSLDSFAEKPVAVMHGTISLVSGMTRFWTRKSDGPGETNIMHLSLVHGDPVLSMNFDHRDQEFATKILSEKRAQMIAHQRMKPGYYRRATLEPIDYGDYWRIVRGEAA